MADKYVITKSKLDALATSINDKAGTSGAMTIAQMQAAVDGLSVGAAPKAVSWHQCPEAVRLFLEEVSYDPSDTTTSQIAAYAPATAVKSNCKPVSQGVGEKTFASIVPGVAWEFVSGSQFGTVQALDALRWIDTTDAPNVRDLGGWACDGGSVKYGLLYRGGEPTANDREVLVEECGVRHDLNLRGSSEAPWTVSPLGEDIWFTRAENTNWYTAAVNDAWKTNIRCVFDAASHNEPVLLHCAAGADRTATLACVLEGLLGMRRSDIDKDYELTCFSTGTATDALARRRNEEEWQGLIASIAAFGGDSFRDQCVAFVAALGFTTAEINRFRQSMTDGSPEWVTPADAPAYTNLLPLAVGNDGEIQKDASGNALGYADGYYLSGIATNSWQNMTYVGEDSAFFLTGFIPYTKAQANAGTPIYVKGATIDTTNSHTRMGGYNSYDLTTYLDPVKFSTGYISVETLSEGYYKLTPKATFVTTMEKSTDSADFQYVRFSFGGSGDGVIITVDEPIE